MLNTKQFQRNLKVLGYYRGFVDGLNGVVTKEGIKAFQGVYSLEADGIYGPKTDAKLREVAETLQRALNEYLKGKPESLSSPREKPLYEKLVIDGIIGNKTCGAIEFFQKYTGITPVGVAGAATLQALGIGKLISFKQSKYFKQDEFRCRCKGAFCKGFPEPVSEILLTVLERAREHYSDRLIITSGLRCEKQNRRDGGILRSRHLIGRAADCYIPSVADKTLCQYFKKQPEVRYTYTGFGAVHVDVY
ncbi:MAG: hypothetical protein GX061_05790 [Eubacteriaceae bacterium]|nr:hypothetical protein [Eubacteriaceae bacterium]